MLRVPLLRAHWRPGGRLLPGRAWSQRACSSSSTASPVFTEHEKQVFTRQQDLMGRLLSYSERYGLDTRHLEEARDCSTVRIAIAGPVGAGKSSAFNLICGEKIQKVHFTRCTSTVTKLTMPAGHPLYGFTLVDTPGRDYSGEDREIGDAVLSASDILIYMTSKERLLNEQDRRELRLMHEKNPGKSYVIVVNKMDLCESDLEFEAIRTHVVAQCLGAQVGLPHDNTSFVFVSIKAAESPGSQVPVPFAPPGMELLKVFLGPLRGHHQLLLNTLRRKLEDERLAHAKIQANSRAIAQASQRARERHRQVREAEEGRRAGLRSYLQEGASALACSAWVKTGAVAAVVARLSAGGRKWITTSWMEEGMVIGGPQETARFNQQVGLVRAFRDEVVPALKHRMREQVRKATELAARTSHPQGEAEEEEKEEGSGLLREEEDRQRWQRVERLIDAKTPAILSRLEHCLTSSFEERQESVNTFTKSLLGLGAVTAVAAVPLKMSAAVAASGILSWTLLAQLPYSLASSFPLCTSANDDLCSRWEASLQAAQKDITELMQECIAVGTEDLKQIVEARCEAVSESGQELEELEAERKELDREAAATASSSSSRRP